MELFAKIVNCLCKITPSYMFDWVLMNVPYRKAVLKVSLFNFHVGVN